MYVCARVCMRESVCACESRPNKSGHISYTCVIKSIPVLATERSKFSPYTRCNLENVCE